ncbi:MAG: hypothetical protein H0T89_06205 [Deltaproteobacteria bacterium]|nr:hypothetical protein [Deltaproteobacteria bacterium]MDQ3296660.1 hypothetical protein [Myxococcota bacterium]
MAMSYEDAVAELFQAPHAAFIGERKRLAGELKAAGDKAAATTLGKLPRPSISVWVVNQMWWHARDAFEALFETAEKLRAGQLEASGPHRAAIAKLRARAATILADAGHAATEATLRRVTTTLSALAAAGSFEPDLPGALAADRDPPGFEAVGIPTPVTEDDAAGDGDDDDDAEKRAAKRKTSAAHPAGRASNDNTNDGAATTKRELSEARRREQTEAKRAEAEAATERKRAEQAEAKRLAEQRQLESALRTAQLDLDRRTKEHDRLRKAAEDAERAVEKARTVVAELESQLASLAEADV